jgi:transposase
MNEPTAFVGLDVHADSTAIGVADPGRTAPRFVGTVGARFAELTKALGKLGEPSNLMIVYEMGPCGYALARELIHAGYHCEVVASSKVPDAPGSESRPIGAMR